MTREDVLAIIQELNIYASDDAYDIKGKIKDHGLSNSISVFNGISKYCLVFKDWDFVIKWRAGVRWQEESENEALKEVKVYEAAKEARLEMFFPYTELIGKINDVYFVMQAKIDYSASDCPADKCKKYRNISKTATLKMINKVDNGFQLEDYYSRHLDNLWISMILVIYGKTVCKKLCKFIHENKINDLHGGNVGYKNDKPIILDFSGYFR